MALGQAWLAQGSYKRLVSDLQTLSEFFSNGRTCLDKMKKDQDMSGRSFLKEEGFQFSGYSIFIIAELGLAIRNWDQSVTGIFHGIAYTGQL